MKNSILKFIVLSIITTFTFSSCSDYLDKQPDDQLDLESVFENKKNMERWLAYIYRGLPEYYTYDGPDAIADELIPSVGWEAQGFKAIQYQKGNWTADNPGILIPNISVLLICLLNMLTRWRLYRLKKWTL